MKNLENSLNRKLIRFSGNIFSAKTNQAHSMANQFGTDSPIASAQGIPNIFMSFLTKFCWHRFCYSNDVTAETETETDFRSFNGSQIQLYWIQYIINWNWEKKLGSDLKLFYRILTKKIDAFIKYHYCLIPYILSFNKIVFSKNS